LVLIVDDRGKAAVAESGLVPLLLDVRFAVFAADLRGRGETLGRIQPRHDTNFRLLANQVLLGQPLAGRRAFDLIRTLDYAESRPEVAATNVTVLGFGEDALPALLAAAVDARIGRVALSGYVHSFISQMVARPAEKLSLPMQWNDPQLDGIIASEAYRTDFGSVIPGALQVLDIPDLIRLVAPRQVLFSASKDWRAPGLEELSARFREAGANGNWLRYEPDHPLDAKRLPVWLDPKHQTAPAADRPSH
jgi:hypothetical protein